MKFDGIGRMDLHCCPPRSEKLQLLPCLILLHLYLGIDVLFYHVIASVTYRDNAVGRVPQMSAPQFRLQFRMLGAQPSGGITLDDLDHIGRTELRPAVNHHVKMVWHDFQSDNGELILLCNLRQIILKFLIDTIHQNLSPVLRAPDDMVLN